MPDPSKPRQFMREKIVKQPISKKQIAIRIVTYFCLALMFGVTAAVSFVVTRPVAERFFGGKPPQETTPIEIPKDDPETVAQSEASDPQETEPIEDMIQAAMEKYDFSAGNINRIYAGLHEVTQETDPGIVTVHSVKQQIDWFDNPVENTGLYAGAVIADNGTELLILTPDAAVEEADSIKVTFSDGTELGGTIKQSDKIAGLAIVSVKSSDMSQELKDQVKILELGNSYLVKQGDLVLAVGSPAGMVHSTSYGFISYVTRNVQVTDGVTRLLYTDMKGDAKKGTFLMNVSGQLIGWVTDAYQEGENAGYTAVMSISDYKAVLEKLTNGASAPYFGIVGQEVSREMADKGLPEGVYVANSVADSPAYNAGIQNGDIITAIGEKKITSWKDFQAELEELIAQQVVTVRVQRNGRDEFTELQFQVTVGAR